LNEVYSSQQRFAAKIPMTTNKEQCPFKVGDTILRRLLKLPWYPMRQAIFMGRLTSASRTVAAALVAVRFSS